jgi:uncharacterized protein (TIGR03435 family)
LAVLGLNAQTNATPTAAHNAEKKGQTSETLAFDVISIHPSKPGGSWFIGTSRDEYHSIDLPLWRTIMRAYFPSAFRSRDLLQGAPAWVWNDNYDFVAKVAPAEVTEWDNQRLGSPSARGTMLQTMLQAALAQRCMLIAHRVPAETPGYALMIAKRGPNLQKMKEARPDQTLPSNALNIPEGGRAIPSMTGQKQELTFLQTSMASLAAELTIQLSLPVEDQTGLKGQYNFVLSALEDLPAVDQAAVSATAPRSSPSWNLDELGLQLRTIKIATEKLVIDYIQRPSAN